MVVVGLCVACRSMSVMQRKANGRFAASLCGVCESVVETKFGIVSFNLRLLKLTTPRVVQLGPLVRCHGRGVLAFGLK